METQSFITEDSTIFGHLYYAVSKFNFYVMFFLKIINKFIAIYYMLSLRSKSLLKRKKTMNIHSRLKTSFIKNNKGKVWWKRFAFPHYVISASFKWRNLKVLKKQFFYFSSSNYETFKFVSQEKKYSSRCFALKKFFQLLEAPMTESPRSFFGAGD